MVPTCANDPVVCIDFVILFIGEFLKDWTTMAMLAFLLVLLFCLRGEQRKARELDYAKQMEAYDDKRMQQRTQTGTWDVKEGKWIDGE
jgi:hypothetical protein